MFVDTWFVLGPVEGQFIEPVRSARLLMNYLQRLGVKPVVRRLKSRLSEARRNQKVHALGTGRIMEAPDDSPFRRGDRVAFYAPNHPRDPSVVVVPIGCVVPEHELADPPMRAPSDGSEAVLARCCGFSLYSGATCDYHALQAAIKQLISKGHPATDHPLPTVHTTLGCRPAASRSRPDAVLFGLGNYAKTHLLPNVKKYLDVVAIHEIDPDQLAYLGSNPRVLLSTDPTLDGSSRYDACFIAGFHHTHASLALNALKSGSYAVVEKPLATTTADFEAVKGFLDTSQERRLFVAFHKRYSILDQYVKKDLCNPGVHPINMHAIVYEIPLPARHWYNWPASGSRIVSNGCHWLDYFMFVNGYPAVRDFCCSVLRGTDVCIVVRLENSAHLTLTLTDVGSQRLGVREVVELRSKSTTARIVDNWSYESENSSRVIRRVKANPESSYERMYRSIAKRIGEGGDGDEMVSLRSTELMLLLEQEYQDVLTNSRCVVRVEVNNGPH